MKKLISLIISAAILAFIYWKIGPENRTRLLAIFANCDRAWMACSLAMVIPLTLCTSWRLQQLMPARGQLGFGEANKLILVASVLNLVLPSKMGDIAKAWFMRDRSGLSVYIPQNNMNLSHNNIQHNNMWSVITFYRITST